MNSESTTLMRELIATLKGLTEAVREVKESFDWAFNDDKDDQETREHGLGVKPAKPEKTRWRDAWSDD
jgi:hypothetical protein